VLVVHHALNAPTYHTLDRRTVAEIQKKIIKYGRQALLSRLANAKDDKKTITTWKFDLNKILHVFNVCSVIAARILLTPHSQTELAFNTRVIFSDVRHGSVTLTTNRSNVSYLHLAHPENRHHPHRGTFLDETS